MADDSLATDNQDLATADGLREPPKVSIENTSGDIAVRKNGNDIEIEFDTPITITRKRRFGSSLPARVAASALAAAPAHTNEPYDMFSNPDTTEQAPKQELPPDAPQEGRDFGLKEPGQVDPNQQDAVANDLEATKAAPYEAMDDDQLGDLMKGDIGQFANDPNVKGIAAADSSPSTTPPAISNEEQANDAAPGLANARAQQTHEKEQEQQKQTTAQSNKSEETSDSDEKIDAAKGSHAAILAKLPIVGAMMRRADSLLKKDPEAAAKLYGRMAFITSRLEQGFALKDLGLFFMATLETVIIPLLMFFCLPVLVVFVAIKPEWISPTAKRIHSLSIFLKKQQKNAEILVQQRAAKKRRTLQNRQ